MKNAYAIADLAGMMVKNCESISALAMGVNNAEQNDNSVLLESYKDILMNELENVQHMTVALTEICLEIVGAQERQDNVGSLFQPGELEDDLGDKTEPESHAAEEEDE